jgi:hypothetical protein
MCCNPEAASVGPGEDAAVALPRRVFDVCTAHSARPVTPSLLAEDVVRVFADSALPTGTPSLDNILPNRGITYGSIVELFGPAGCGKSFLSARFVRSAVSSSLLLSDTSIGTQVKGVPLVRVHWIISSTSQCNLVAATVREILEDTGAQPGNLQAAGEHVGRALTVSLVSSANDLLRELELCASRLRPADSSRSVVVLDSIYSILLGEDMQFGTPGQASSGGAAYTSVVGTIRRLLRNLASLYCAVWVVNGATSSNPRNAGRYGADLKSAARPYGGQLWFTTADVTVEMKTCWESPDDNESIEELSNISHTFSLFRPQGIVSDVTSSEQRN